MTMDCCFVSSNPIIWIVQILNGKDKKNVETFQRVTFGYFNVYADSFRCVSAGHWHILCVCSKCLYDNKWSGMTLCVLSSFSLGQFEYISWSNKKTQIIKIILCQKITRQFLDCCWLIGSTVFKVAQCHRRKNEKKRKDFWNLALSVQ